MPLFLSDEEYSRCSGDAALVAERADEFIRRLNKELETIKAESDAAAITAEQTCSLLEQKYLSLSSEFSDLQSQYLLLQSSIDQRLAELADVQAQKHQLHLQCIGKDGEIERLSTEMSELHKSKRQLMELVEHKDAELFEKNASIKSYLDKIVSLTDNAAQKEARFNDNESELTRSQTACSRLSQEKELIERHNVWLNDELEAKSDSLIEMRRKYADLEALMSSKNADAERELNECSASLKWNKDRVRDLEAKIVALQEELCSCKESAAANEERFSAEVSTVHKLVELYKESSEEWSRKAGELEGVIKALEVHLTQVETDYKDKIDKEVSARRQAEKEAEDLKVKLEKTEAEIESLRKENELSLLPLSSFNTERWMGSFDSSHTVEDSALIPKIPIGVSGTALAASLLRDGWSLAKMYTKYQEAVDALRHEQMGRKEAEAVLKRVLYELEEKAEVIMDERAEHERMVEAYSAINQKLQQSSSEQFNLEKTIQGLKADLKKHERDYQLAQHEIVDLKSQVTVLLKECRDVQLRCGSSAHEADDETMKATLEMDPEADAEKVISERLLTFKDINGLVEQNVQLRSLVRNLSHQLDEKEIDFKEKFERELRNQTDEAASKVAAVLQRAGEQAEMIDSLHTSVAMYKRLYEEEHKRHSSSLYPKDDTTIVAQEDARKDCKLLIEGSQEAAKKAQEKAAERVRCLEEQLEKSRSKIVALQSERDKLALEADFGREKLDSLLKESEHKREELDRVLARNVEFSQLIIDYQRKLRDSSESLHAAEDLTRKLTMEVSVLKHEKEMLTNAERRASDEVRNLSERVHRLQATLDTIQSAEGVREVVYEARVAEKRKQEEHIKQIQREWAEAKKDLQDERDNVRNLTIERDQTLRNAMKQVEEMGKELAIALHAVSAAESRAAVAEARLSDLERKIKSSETKVDGNGGSSFTLTDEVVAELQTSKEEVEKLKEEAKANKEHMMQYKSIAQVNEAALKQIEHAHEVFKAEAERLKNSLETEVLSLRKRVSELEMELNLKSEEVASVIAGKEEALASVSAEIASLKEENVAKTTQVLSLETKYSLLEEKWKNEHERWRSAHSNYERQVILQSETIQELTRTSEALSVLQEEASETRRLSDALKRENDDLKSKWLEEKSVLEETISSTEKKYYELNEQNKLLHDRLDALHIQLAERERSGGSSSGGLAADTGLQNVINYLRRSKEIAETEISLLKQEKLRLQSQLESALKSAETAQASLNAVRANSKTLLFTEEEFRSLQHQVREISLLRESNQQLREENKHNYEECQRLREETQKARAESDKLEKQLRDTQTAVEACKKEIEMHRLEKIQLERRVADLLERCGGIDVEQYECMKNEVCQMQEKLKERDSQIEEIKVLASQKQDKTTQLEKDLQNCRAELNEKEKRLQDMSQVEEKQKKLVTQFKRKADILTKEKEDLTRENQALLKQLEDLKQGKRPSSDVTVEQVTKEKEEKDTRIQILERTVERQREGLKKEREKRQKSEETIMDSLRRADEEKSKVSNELEKHKQALKQLSTEVEKMKHAEGDLPEGTTVLQLLSGGALDDLASGYLLAIESFEQVAHSLASQLGSRVASQDTYSVPDTSLSSPAAPAQATASAPDKSSMSAKSVEEKERTIVPRGIGDTRKTVRKLVRPRSVAEETPDVEMADVGAQEAEGNSVPQLRKRQASPVTELQERSLGQGESASDVVAPLLKRSKGLQDASEGQSVSPAEHTIAATVVVESSNAAADKESFDVPQMEDSKMSQDKAEDRDSQPAEGFGQIEGKAEESIALEENLDKGGETGDGPGDQIELQPSGEEATNDKEEVEFASDVAEAESGDIMGSPEQGEAKTEQATTVPVASPSRADDLDVGASLVEPGEVAPTEDEKVEDGEITDEATELVAGKIEQAAEVAAESVVSGQQGSSSPTPAAAAASVSAGEADESKRASPNPTTINLFERARERAALRQAGVITTTTNRGRVVRGRGVRGRAGGRAGGRGQPSGEQGQGPR